MHPYHLFSINYFNFRHNLAYNQLILMSNTYNIQNQPTGGLGAAVCNSKIRTSQDWQDSGPRYVMYQGQVPFFLSDFGIKQRYHWSK